MTGVQTCALPIALGEFATALTQPQLKRLGARFNRKTQLHEAPTESTLRRVLQGSDAAALDQALGQWFFQHSSPDEAIAVDGKTQIGRASGRERV